MQHLWLTERICDIVGAELEIDPVEMRKRNYVTTERDAVRDAERLRLRLGRLRTLPGHGARAGRLRARSRSGAREAESRGKLLGLGIGSTLDSGTNNFGQSQLLNPELQFSGNNEAATVKLDIFGEVVVTLGTVPQGQGHETTAAQVVADILGCSPDQVTSPRARLVQNSHAGFSGTYASQFAVTGLGAVKGAAELLRDEMIELAAVVLQAEQEQIELADGMARVKDGPAEAALPFMALGAIVNANNAFLPPDFNPTLNHRYVYRRYFGIVDTEKKIGKLTLTYSMQIHACVVEIDRETGAVEIVDYGAVDDCGTRIHPQIVEGQVHGATAHAIGAALHENFVYDEDGTLLTANFYDYHVPHALDMPPIRRRRRSSRLAVHAARREGHGRGRRRRHPRDLLGDPGRPAAGRRPIVYDSCNPNQRVWEMLNDPESTRANVEVTSR